MLGVVAGIPTHRHPQSFRMNKIPMAALAAPALKPGLFQVGYQLANLARHFSINLVSQLFKTVKPLNLAVTARKNLFNTWGWPFRYFSGNDLWPLRRGVKMGLL